MHGIHDRPASVKLVSNVPSEDLERDGKDCIDKGESRHLSLSIKTVCDGEIAPSRASHHLSISPNGGHSFRRYFPSMYRLLNRWRLMRRVQSRKAENDT